MQTYENFWDIFDGLMLGDGGVFPVSNNSLAYYRQSCKHKEYLVYLKNLAEQEKLVTCPSHPRQRIHYKKGTKNPICYSYTFDIRGSEEFGHARSRWYNNRIKFLPLDLILTPSIVRQWYIGDGNLGYEGDYLKRLKFSTHNFTKEEVGILKELLDFSIGVCSHIGASGDGHWVLEVYRGQLNNILSYIGPCSHPCYQYKWETDRKKYNYLKTHCLCPVFVKTISSEAVYDETERSTTIPSGSTT